jgi:hypothetical protein
VDILKQKDPLWAKVKLGKTTLTVGAAGCLATCYAQALRALGIDETATPATVVAACVTANGFLRAGIVQPVLSKALGIHADDVVTAVQTAQVMRAVIVKGLERGVVILHVDHDHDRAGGDDDGDHFVLATRIEGDRIYYCDPATGSECWLDLRTMSGMAEWGDPRRRYEVRSARPLRAA